MSKGIIAVTGATGQQGGAIVRSLLRHGQYAVRAFTRNTDSDKAKALKEAGAEVVQADLDGDESSLETALKGAKGAFLVTNYWEYHDVEREFNQGKKFVDAAKKAGVEHLVYSGLENAEKLTDGRLKCGHFTAKGRVEEYLATAGLPKYSIVRLAAYVESIIPMAQKQEDGTYVLTLPMANAKLHVIAVDDIGDVVHSVFENSEEYNGKRLGLAGDYLTVADITSAMSSASGETVRYQSVPVDVFAKFPFPGADDLAEMFQFIMDEGEKLRDVELTRKLNPRAQTLEQFLANNKAKLDEALLKKSRFAA